MLLELNVRRVNELTLSVEIINQDESITCKEEFLGDICVYRYKDYTIVSEACPQLTKYTLYIKDIYKTSKGLTVYKYETKEDADTMEIFIVDALKEINNANYKGNPNPIPNDFIHGTYKYVQAEKKFLERCFS